MNDTHRCCCIQAKSDLQIHTWLKNNRKTRRVIMKIFTVNLLRAFLVTSGIFVVYYIYSHKEAGTIASSGIIKDKLDRNDIGVYTGRINHLKEICIEKKTLSNTISIVYGTRDGRLSICAIPKAACTSWGRIVRFLNGQKSNLITSPFDISKFETHYKRTNYLYEYNYQNNTHKRIIENSTRVINSRDPYSRVWSAYIDKFLLPDFWKSKGIAIIEQFRQNPTNKSLLCGHDVSFSEFIEYVVSLDGEPFQKPQNVHWYPASTICDPCLFRPNYDAKQETFSKDVHHILESLDYNVFQNATQKHSMDTFEMKDQIDYVVSIYGEHIKMCITDKDLLSRLWTAFQYNGYLPISAKFPGDKLNIMEKESVSKIMEDAFYDWKVTKTERKAQKRYIMINAYRNLSLETLRKFQKMFMYDFTLFEYEIEPSDIFNGRYD